MALKSKAVHKGKNVKAAKKKASKEKAAEKRSALKGVPKTTCKFCKFEETWGNIQEHESVCKNKSKWVKVKEPVSSGPAKSRKEKKKN
ncbi:hypothetical protein Tco_0058226 [Tanacetum coccineum]